jgi:uncharacterized protein DUF262
MKTTATNKKVRELMTALKDEALIPRPYFQRRLVWTMRHKQLFVQTVLDGYPFPEIFLCDGKVDLESGKGAQLVVDGQQRITTLQQYFLGSDDLRLGDLTPYSDLTDEQKHTFLDYQVVVRDLGRLSENEIREVFHRMNSTNYGLNAMEVNNARFNGALKLFSEEVSQWPFFEEHRVFNSVDIRRMGDVRWVLTLIITLIAGYFTRDSEHEVYLRRFNDDFPERDRVRAQLNDTLDLIDRLELGVKSRAWQKSDIFTLIVEIYKHDPGLVSDEDGLGEALREFYLAVDAVSDERDPESWGATATAYHAAVISGSNERARRIRRGNAIGVVLKRYFVALEE